MSGDILLKILVQSLTNWRALIKWIWHIGPPIYVMGFIPASICQFICSSICLSVNVLETAYQFEVILEPAFIRQGP